jgi:hypothetical protein
VNAASSLGRSLNQDDSAWQYLDVRRRESTGSGSTLKSYPLLPGQALPERVGFEPTVRRARQQPISVLRLQPLSHLSLFRRYFDRADIGRQTWLEKSCLKSLDQMDCSAQDMGSAVELALVRGPLNLLSRRKGTSTSAERMAPLNVRSSKAFRLR